MKSNIDYSLVTIQLMNSCPCPPIHSKFLTLSSLEKKSSHVNIIANFYLCLPSFTPWELAKSGIPSRVLFQNMSWSCIPFNIFRNTTLPLSLTACYFLLRLCATRTLAPQINKLNNLGLIPIFWYNHFFFFLIGVLTGFVFFHSTSFIMQLGSRLLIFSFSTFASIIFVYIFPNKSSR